MKASLFLLFQGVLLYDTLGWEVRMPKLIQGLKGSCLVIPCSFSYTSYPPTNPRRVVWYQWVSKGYPLVYDPLNPNDVIEKFRWKTDLYGEPLSKDCSLLIKNLEQSHHGEKIYAWIDPENVGYRTYKFYDVTSTIQVNASPRLPGISISGGERTGDNITVACSTFHTCPYSKPNITLNGIEGSDQIKDESIKDGLWKITLTRTGVVKTENSTIQCSVRHHGGETVTDTKNTSAQCVHHNITIEPELADVTEGVTKSFTCSVYHSCQKEPTITWNYENMQVTKGSKTLSGLNRVTFSNMTFLRAKEDQGKKLICTANFSGENITTSVDLHVQCLHYNITIEPELADVTEGDAVNFTCTIYHSCQNENPIITWNYENMQVTEWNKTLWLDQISYSSITFLGAKEYHGKKLICTAKFSGRDITASVVINVQCQKMQCQQTSLSPDVKCRYQMFPNPALIMIMKLNTPTWVNSTSMEISDEHQHQSKMGNRVFVKRLTMLEFINNNKTFVMHTVSASLFRNPNLFRLLKQTTALIYVYELYM